MVARPPVPAKWLAEAAARDLPMLISKLNRMKFVRKRWPDKWGNEEKARMDELMADIAAARRLRHVRFEWTNTDRPINEWEIIECDNTTPRRG